jgi:5'-nucleotidase (lipoprotein e(P4) family)
MRRLTLALTLAAALGCRTAAPVVAPVPPAPPAPPVPVVAPVSTPAAPAPATARAAAAMSTAIRWARESAEHRALFLQVFAMATAQVERAAQARAAGTWAIVADADETLIDNSAYQLEQAEKGLGFDSASWRAWTARKAAPALPGAAAFLARVRALGGTIAIVTNRAASECADTEEVFRAAGLAYDAMLCMPEGGPSDKNPRFDAVAKGTTPFGLPPLEVVAFLGDNIRDFPGLGQSVRGKPDEAFAGFGTRFFLLPNPMYGSWEPR